MHAVPHTLKRELPFAQREAEEGPEANIIKKNDKLLGRFIPYFTCKIWNKNAQYVVLKKHDILDIFIPYFTRKI